MRGFANCTHGGVALEFAIVAPALYFFMLGLIDYCVFDYRRSELQHVLYEASRKVQVGEIEAVSGGINAKKVEFARQVCDAVVSALDCSKIYFDVRNFCTIDQVTFPAATFTAAGVPTNFVFEPGGSERITVMRAAIPHRFATGFLSRIFEPVGDPAIVVGFSVAKNEPFPGGVPC